MYENKIVYCLTIDAIDNSGFSRYSELEACKHNSMATIEIIMEYENSYDSTAFNVRCIKL